MTHTRRLRKAVDLQNRLYEGRMNHAFYLALKHNEHISANQVWEEAIKLELPPKEVEHFLAPLFKRFKKNGLIVKTGNYELSSRSSKPLPIYISRQFQASTRDAQDALGKEAFNAVPLSQKQ